MSRILNKSIDVRLAGAMKPNLEIAFRFQKDEEAKTEISGWTKEIRREYASYVVEEAMKSKAAKTLLSRIPGLNDFCKEGENFPTVEFFWDVKTEEGDTENIVFSVAFPKEIKEFILADEAYKLVLEIQELEEDFWYNKQGEEEGVGISTHSTVEERIDMTHLLLSYRSGCIQCDDFDKLLTFGKPKVSEKTMQELKEYKTHLESELSNSAEVADATEVAIAVSTD